MFYEKPTLRGRHLTRTFGSGETSTTALHDVSLDLFRGQLALLMGPSGSGKSTILRILAGLITPSRGEVLYHGQPLAGLNPGVAIVFQSFALYPWMTVTQNIEAVLKAAGRSTKEVHERAGEVIRTVGLAGFEGAFPRELSGGMKQRVGIARALSLDPEILFLDEPFSQVDALTAEGLRAEVIALWSGKKNPVSVLMVSHDIREVVYMADRIVILGANPGRVRTVVENHLPRPRDYRSPEFLKLMDQLHETIAGHEMPDVPAPSAPGPRIVEPLPAATTSEIVGLLGFLSARGGTAQLFQIAAETHRDFGRTMAVVKAAELLDFVDTPKQAVVLTEKGRKFVVADRDGRRALWREGLLQLHLFREVRDLMDRQQAREIDASLVLDLIVMNLPQENYQKTFQTFVRWARFGNLFSYDASRKRLSLP
jgi:NitT/TauT family transport system ATP-binding protein